MKRQAAAYFLLLSCLLVSMVWSATTRDEQGPTGYRLDLGFRRLEERRRQHRRDKNKRRRRKQNRGTMGDHNESRSETNSTSSTQVETRLVETSQSNRTKPNLQEAPATRKGKTDKGTSKRSRRNWNRTAYRMGKGRPKARNRQKGAKKRNNPYYGIDFFNRKGKGKEPDYVEEVCSRYDFSVGPMGTSRPAQPFRNIFDRSTDNQHGKGRDRKRPSKGNGVTRGIFDRERSLFFHNEREFLNGDAENNGQTGCSPNILDAIRRRPDLSSLARLLEYAGLESIFECPGPFTLLAPSNEALVNVVATILGRDNRDNLKDFLLYHVLSGSKQSDSFSAGSQPTLLGDSVQITLDPLRFDGSAVAEGNIGSCNGIIHVLEEALTPPSLGGELGTSIGPTAPSPTVDSPSGPNSPTSSPPSAPNDNPTLSPPSGPGPGQPTGMSPSPSSPTPSTPSPPSALSPPSPGGPEPSAPIFGSPAVPTPNPPQGPEVPGPPPSTTNAPNVGSQVPTVADPANTRVPTAGGPSTTVAPTTTDGTRFPTVSGTTQAPAMGVMTLTPSLSSSGTNTASPTTDGSIFGATIAPSSRPSHFPTMTASPTSTAPPSVSSAPTLQPTEQLIRVRVTDYYISLVVPTLFQEPAQGEIDELFDATARYWTKVFEDHFEEIEADPLFRGVDLTLVEWLYDAGLPEPAFNIYMEFDMVVLYELDSPSQPGTEESFAIMVESDLVEYILDFIRPIPTFASTNEVDFKAIERFEDQSSSNLFIRGSRVNILSSGGSSPARGKRAEIPVDEIAKTAGKRDETNPAFKKGKRVKVAEEE